MDDFYSQVARRPLIDVVQAKEEQDFWQKSFENSNDITLYTWRKDWLQNTKDNLAHFGYFKRDHSVKIYANELINKPVVLVGSGPSLAKNIDKLKMAKEMGMTIISNHHSVMYLSRPDVQIKPDYVVCLDAGHMWDDYFAHDGMDFTDVPLLADQTCNSSQLQKWEGPVKFFKSTQPETTNIGKFLKMELDRIIDPFDQGSIIEVGGHVGGAMMSIVTGVMTASTVIFIGSDYCFDKTMAFYPFDHKVDKEVDGKDFGQEGKMLPAAPPPQGMIFDIAGDMVQSNGAYLGFKNVMDISIKAMRIGSLQNNKPIEFINATEGGALGALQGGNSMWMRYMKLEDALIMADTKRKGG